MKRDDYHLALESTGSKISGYVTCQPDTYVQFDDCFNPDKDSTMMDFEFHALTFLNQ